MAQQGLPNERTDDRDSSAERAPFEPSVLDSAMRRKFLNFCQENPWADECRIYES